MSDTPKERPILFSAPMVRAILDGTKTMTRRVVKPQPSSGVRESVFVGSGLEDGHGREIRCPYGQVGDRLWVREAWQSGSKLDVHKPATITAMAAEAGYYRTAGPVWYPADDGYRQWCDSVREDREEFGEPGRVRSPIFMPRWASRITLEITEVRCERLQEITTRDAMKEGIPANSIDEVFAPGVTAHLESLPIDQRAEALRSAPVAESRPLPPRKRFLELWDTINPKYPAESNPFVWVITFKRV